MGQTSTTAQQVMTIGDQEDGRVGAEVDDRIREAADAAQIAEAIAAVLQEIDAALTPIIGQRGVATVYTRSLHLTVALHPWLPTGQEGVQAAMDPTALKSVLAQQSGAEAAAGGRAVLQTFHDILASLIGPSLTEKLLRSVWEHSLSGPPAQDMSP